jgi:MYXO-CTERM domain-containing protein
LVEYYAGDRRLYGNGALATGAPAGITSSPVQTFLFEDREWLQITPDAIGDYDIPFSAGGIGIGSLRVHAVEASAVDRIELAHEYQLELSDVDEDEELVVLGVARGVDNRAIYGVEFVWDLDGNGVPGLGDLFRYPYKPDVDATLGAEFDGLRSETLVHAESGYVDSSNQLGCSTGGHDDGDGLWLLSGLGLALLASRRRRG